MNMVEMIWLIAGAGLLAIGVFMALLPKINRKKFAQRRSVGGISLSRFSYFMMAAVAIAGAAAATAQYAGRNEIAQEIGGLCGLMIFLSLFSFLFDGFAAMSKNEQRFRKNSAPLPKARRFAKPGKPRGRD